MASANTPRLAAESSYGEILAGQADLVQAIGQQEIGESWPRTADGRKTHLFTVAATAEGAPELTKTIVESFTMKHAVVQVAAVTTNPTPDADREVAFFQRLLGLADSALLFFVSQH
jgi:hypothetical protein